MFSNMAVAMVEAATGACSPRHVCAQLIRGTDAADLRPNRARVAMVISSAAVSVVRSARTVKKQLGGLSMLTCARRKRFQRISVAIDPGDLDARRQQASHHRPADPPAAPDTIATLWVSLMACFLGLCQSSSYFRFRPKSWRRPSTSNLDGASSPQARDGASKILF